MLITSLAVFAMLYGEAPDAKHAWAVHDFNRPKPDKVEPAAVPGGAPSDAIVLFDGTRESFEKNWCDKDGHPSKWTLGTEGDFYSRDKWQNGGDIFTRTEFGDCQLHLEFRHEAEPLELDREPQMRGNSGVFLMNWYTEIQILESYFTRRQDCRVDTYSDGISGAMYAENPPLVNAQRKPGEWQTYDIIFHQPVWDGLRLVHPGSVTLLFNGVVVQDHWELEGLKTHERRKPLAPHKPTGQLRLQDHGCVVHFRNIWYRPLASRWANTTHSLMSGNENDVMACRRNTAAELYAKIADKEAVTGANVLALGEVLAYADEPEYRAAFLKCLEAYRAKPGDAKEVAHVNERLGVLVKAGVLKADQLVK